MHIFGMNCSQRDGSNSGRLLAYVLSRLTREEGGEHTVVSSNIRDLKIECLGCAGCLADLDFHTDDLAAVYREILKADVVLFSTPTCYGMPSASAKAMMDRSDPLWNTGALKGKRGAVIVNGASSDDRIEECRNAVHMYFEAHGMETLLHNPCFTKSEQYPDNRYPDPLPEELRHELDELVAEVENLKA